MNQEQSSKFRCQSLACYGGQERAESSGGPLIDVPHRGTAAISQGYSGREDSGFSALPGGVRYNLNGTFDGVGTIGYWWSASPSGTSNAWYRILQSGLDNVSRTSYYNMRSGFSVRCIRNFEPILGCTDPTYLEYNSVANTDNGSCATLVVNGCTNPAFNEYNPNANTDDGSCASLLGCTNSAFVEYNPQAIVDDGSCAILQGCTANDVVSMDGHNYSVIQIGNQCWFKENLRTALYANGDSIPDNLSNSEWTSTSSGAQAIYDNNDANLTTFGRLYNWYAVNDSRGLCPSGWHVPTSSEWITLRIGLGDTGVAGPKMKSSPSDTPSWDGTNESGFSALPGGTRHGDNGSFTSGGGSYGYWWSSSLSDSGNAWGLSLYSGNNYSVTGSSDHRDGFSVRCVRDLVMTIAAAEVVDGETSEDASLSLTFTTWESTTDFAASDITVTNGVISGFAGSGMTYTATFTPAGAGACTINVAGGTFTGATGAINAASDEFNWTYAVTPDAFTFCGDGIGYNGYNYTTVEIGSQCWFKKDLRTALYANGDSIPGNLTIAVWTSTTLGAQVIYDNNDANLITYGRLYNWHAVNDSRGLCPSGWHVPTDAEWATLVTVMGGEYAAGYNVKSSPNDTPSWNGSNSSGFSALPGGYLQGQWGAFNNEGSHAEWWSSSPNETGGALSRGVSSFSAIIPSAISNKRSGFSVRCVRPVSSMAITAAEVSDGESSSDPSLSLTFTAQYFTTDFTASDITVTNGSISGFNGYGSTYTANFIPAGDGPCTITVAAGTFTDEAGNSNIWAADEFNWTYVATPPTMIITAAEVLDGGSSTDASLSLTFTSSESMLDFDASDVTVTNGSISDFAYASPTTYTATFTSAAAGACTINVAAGAFTDYNGDINTAADEFNWTYFPPPSAFTNCGDVIGYNGYNYTTVQIGDQCWFKENLRTTQYADGSSIQLVTNDFVWSIADHDARAAYNNDAYNVAIYGYLYNWYAVANAAGLCPTGWHVPYYEDWEALTTPLNEPWGAAYNMKSSSSDSPSWDGSNSSGFSALPGGFRLDSTGDFYSKGSSGYWWSASPYGPSSATYLKIDSDYDHVYQSSHNQRYGFSVRCMKY